MEIERNVDDAVAALDDFEADLVVLPELFSSGYSLTRKELEAGGEEPPGGYTVERLSELCRAKGMAVVAGFAERGANKFYNSAALITPSEVVVHRKVHLFGREKELFEPGARFEVHRYRRVMIGMMVCFDWFFPESCRTLMLKGAEVIAHPANLVLPFWPKAAVTRAVENRVFIATASRIGDERGMHFIGRSQIVSPSGKILASAGGRRAEQAVVEVDPSEARDKGVTPHNDIVGDRRPDAYELL
jgi:predicted amidohydrolase